MEGVTFERKFSWSLSLNGESGTDGVGIDQIVEEYYLSTSRITPQGGSWSAIRPEWESGKYYWTRSHIYYSDGTEAIVGEICATGDAGADGASVLARYSADKATWHLGMLSTDMWMQTSQDNGKTWSEAVRIAGKDGTDGKDGPYQKMQWAKNNSPETAPTSGWQDSPMSANEGEYVWLRTGTVIPPATAPASYGTPVRLTGDRGKDGQSVYLLDLTNSMAGVACDADGNPVGTLPSTGIQVYTGGTADNTGWKFSVSTDGCTCTLSGWLLKITSITKDTASVTITATKGGCPTLISTFSIYKVKPGHAGTPGTDGDDGAPAVVYSIDPSVNNITRSSTGRLSADYVTCSVYKTTGASARVLTSEKTLTYLRMPDGATGPLNHTGGTSSQIPILADTESVIFELKDGSTLLDHERVPVMNDASDLTIYARGTGNNNSANRVVKVGGKTVVNGDGRGLALTVIDRKTLEVAYTRYFDVYDVEEHRTNLANALKALTTDVLVVITSHDAWYHNNNKEMIEALEDFGGSQFVGSGSVQGVPLPICAHRDERPGAR